ncbi:DUF1127 domain-containing protein [Sneathiella chinensis]|uniref:YjiS-like domain-containing protein n=1 Tax=Sneathiella chinensis TaxID=349750 RepID=A0ABQ5U456_9PROT|nr:DUF1127 domain-containing protein [Sneathiella chinensis]GLQ06018.1 hypothetical protein GCM10007924_12390 [Sneathiella chinensis]
MMSFTKKDIESIAMLYPTIVTNDDVLNYDVEEVMAQARRARSEYIVGMIKGVFAGMTNTIRTRSENRRALNALYSMSDRELSDLGVSRSEIKHAVLGEAAAKTSVSAGFKGKIVAPLVAKFKAWQSSRAGLAQLMAMDARQLSDIGLTRGDIFAASKGEGRFANDNRGAAVSGKGRIAS